MSSNPRTTDTYPQAASIPPGVAGTTGAPGYTDPALMNPATATARTVYETQPVMDPIPATYTVPATRPMPTSGLEQNVQVVTPRDRVRWGSIVAGLLSALATFAILSLLGAALGATTLDANGGTTPNGATPNQFGGIAGIWGAVSALLSFFIGGFIAAKTAAVGGRGNGWINGTMVFLAGIVLIAFLAGQGAGNLFGAIGVNLNDLRILGSNTISDPNARATAVNNARNGLWWSLGSVLVGLIAAGLGGVAGARDEQEVWYSDAEARS